VYVPVAARFPHRLACGTFSEAGRDCVRMRSRPELINNRPMSDKYPHRARPYLSAIARRSRTSGAKRRLGRLLRPNPIAFVEQAKGSAVALISSGIWVRNIS
jgi:hypothetical protein